jgi:hypothetical protein
MTCVEVWHAGQLVAVKVCQNDREATIYGVLQCRPGNGKKFLLIHPRTETERAA